MWNGYQPPPYGPYWPQMPQFIPYPMSSDAPKTKKEKKETLKSILANIQALEEYKKKLEENKKDKDKDKKKEVGFDDLCREVGKITLFGPTLGLIFYEVWKYIH